MLIYSLESDLKYTEVVLHNDMLLLHECLLWSCLELPLCGVWDETNAYSDTTHSMKKSNYLCNAKNASLQKFLHVPMRIGVATLT